MLNLNNYFMKPSAMKNGLLLHPIKLFEYEEFKILSNTFLIMDIEQLNNKRSQERLPKLEQETLYSYLINCIEKDDTILIQNQIKKIEEIPQNTLNILMEENQELRDMVENIEVLKIMYADKVENRLCRLIEMSTKLKVSYVGEPNNAFAIFENSKIKWAINEDNFYEFRDIVMEQNLLFEPIVAPNKASQKYIDAKLNKGKDDESDLESLIAFVVTNTGLDVSEYTYYRLRADFVSLVQQMNRRETVQYSSGGSTTKDGKPLPIPNVIKRLGINDSPYDSLFSESVKGQY